MKDKSSLKQDCFARHNHFETLREIPSGFVVSLLKWSNAFCGSIDVLKRKLSLDRKYLYDQVTTL